MNELLFKSFVIPFYKAFLGFFILIILIFGVFMELKQHLMIAERLLQNTLGFYAILLFFLAFAMAQQRFQLRLMNDKRYRIFHHLGFLTWRQLACNFLPIWVANHLLILLYGALLSFVAIGINTGGKLILLWIFIAGIFLADLTLTYLRLKKPYPDYIRVRSRITKKLKFQFWFLMHLREKRTLLILGVKLVSITLLNGFFYAFSKGSYDLRWLEFGLLCASFAHFPIWLDKHAFESEQLSYFHAMPLRFGWKFKQHSITIMLILLPEFMLLVYKFGSVENLVNLLFLLLLFQTLNMGIYGLIKGRNALSKSLSSGYLSFFILFLLVIFNLQPLILGVICMLPFVLAMSSRYSV
ncbi:hypothetical protein ACPUEN_00320 [Algoriphagus yeomjeoni]|uniref:hypothetical protein n=1 Tax=Algoriphagus yeomjeoni TaxID=291403 RepID=UPI003CE4D6E4